MTILLGVTTSDIQLKLENLYGTIQKTMVSVYEFGALCAIIGTTQSINANAFFKFIKVIKKLKTFTNQITTTFRLL